MGNLVGNSVGNLVGNFTCNLVSNLAGNLVGNSAGNLALAIIKKWKNGSSSPKTRPRAKLTITDPPKIWVSGFPSVNRNGKLALVIMKKWKKMALAFPKSILEQNFQLLIPQSLDLWFLSMDDNRKFTSAIMKIWKHDSSSPKCILKQNFQLPTHPPKFGSLCSTLFLLLHVPLCRTLCTPLHMSLCRTLYTPFHVPFHRTLCPPFHVPLCGSLHEPSMDLIG